MAAQPLSPVRSASHAIGRYLGVCSLALDRAGYVAFAKAIVLLVLCCERYVPARACVAGSKLQ